MSSVYHDYHAVEETGSADHLVLEELTSYPPSLWDRLKKGSSWILSRGEHSKHEKLSSHTVSTHARSRWLLGFRNIIILALAIFGIIVLSIRTVSEVNELTTKPISCDCGHSISEAISMGCKYDTMAASWLTEACRDDELSAEFDKTGPGPNGKWYYWADAHKNRELSIEELSHLADVPGGVFYTEWAWHVAHCTFYWRKQHRGRAYIPPETTYGHIVHCEEVILGDQVGIIVSGVGLNSSTNT